MKENSDMIHITYTEGPESLKDVSLEESKHIEMLLGEGYSDDYILSESNISEDALKDIKMIRNKGLRRCCFCGSLFTAKASRRIQCYKPEHYLPCVDCGTPVKIKESYANYMNAGGRRCSTCRGKQIGLTRQNKSAEEKAAIVAKQEATMIEKYGFSNALKCPEIKEKVQKTVKEKYGVDNLSQSAEIQEKIRQNSRDRYGVDHYSCAPEIRDNMRKGMIQKYGVESAMQNEELREKAKQTNIERYGCENVFQSKEIRDRFVSNHIRKYGVAWPHQRPDLIEQVRQSNMQKYGAYMYPVSDEHMKKVVKNPEKFDCYKEFSADPESFIKAHYVDKPSVAQICEDTGVTDTTIYQVLISHGKRDLATEFKFSLETSVAEFIHNIDSNIEIEKHNRVILKGKELDLFLPEFQLGIECNPTITHNSSFCDPWGGAPKHYKYHADKSNLAMKEGVFLYHVFGHEWANRREAIQSQLRNLLGRNYTRYFARNTKVIDVDYQHAAEFLDSNHRQGNAQSSVRLGLIDKQSSKLISLMTFGKMRTGIGKKQNQMEDEWELIRFCNLCGTSVVGGASKLLKYFETKYSPSKIVSFSDIAHTRGKLYETLGFHKVSVSDPGYVWVSMADDSYLSRVSCQKANLPNLFSDVTEDTLKEHSEREIMMSHGYAQVFDSGVIRWEK